MLTGEICNVLLIVVVNWVLGSMHRSEPRLIMPHQKVHASILYANAYRPRATRGRGFDISMITPEDTELDKSFWETDLFDDMEAQELVNSLGRQRMSGTACLEKLLFMLRFGKFVPFRSTQRSPHRYLQTRGSNASEAYPTGEKSLRRSSTTANMHHSSGLLPWSPITKVSVLSLSVMYTLYNIPSQPAIPRNTRSLLRGPICLQPLHSMMRGNTSRGSCRIAGIDTIPE